MCLEECFSFSAEYFQYMMNKQFLLEHMFTFLGKPGVWKYDTLTIARLTDKWN